MHHVQHLHFVTNTLLIFGVFAAVMCLVVVVATWLGLDDAMQDQAKSSETVVGLLIATVLFLAFAAASTFSLLLYSFIGP